MEVVCLLLAVLIPAGAIVLLVVGIGAPIMLGSRANQRATDRWMERRDRYSALWGEAVAMTVMRRGFCLNMPADALESIGHPEDVDRNVTVKRTIETWKYDRVGRGGRYALRFTLVDGVVTGWDDKR